MKDRGFFVFKAGIFGFASILFVLLCVFSCNNLLTLSEGGSLLVSVPGGRNATDATIYTIELKGEKGSTYSKTVSAGQTAAFEELTPGSYAVVVKGSNDKNVVVYYGTASATVEAGKVSSVKVELQDLLGKLTVDFSGADRAGDGMSFTVEVKSSNGISLSKPIVAGSSVSFEKLIPDTYGVTVKGSDDGKVVYLGTASAVVEVGQTSSVTVQLQNQFGELAVDFSGVDVDSNAKNFTVELHGARGYIYTTTVPSGQTALFERLIPDTYSIEVDGRDEQGKIMLHGTNSVDVAAGKPIAVTVELQPQFGSLSVDFSDTTLASTGTSFSIELRGSKASIYHTTVPSGQIAQFEKLLPDTYVVTVKGTNENQIVVYSGTASAVVDAGESASITVELQTQFGSLSVDFSDTTSASIGTSFSIELRGDSKGSIYTTTVLSGQTAQFEQLIPDTYVVTVKGENENQIVVYSGTASAVVDAGESASITVELQTQFGSLSVDFSDTTSASIGTSFSIELRGDSKGSIYTTTVLSGQTAQFEQLIPDTYVVTVKGENENQIVVYSGTASAVVDAGESASITVELMKVAKIVTDAASLKEAIASGGTVYVVNDITVTESLTINQDVTIRALDKDVTLNHTGSSSLFTVQNSATLTIGGGDYRLTVDGKGQTRGAALLQIKGGTVDLYGTITNGISNDSAGGIKVEGSSSTLNMYDGAIVNNCKCSNQWGIGGGIGLEAGNMNMYGGTITGNTAQDASAVYVNNTSVFTMSGGSISGNSNDIAVNVSSSTFKIGGGAQISSDDKVSLKNSPPITIISPLSSSSSVATITLRDGFSSGSSVLIAENGVTLADEVGKFALSSGTIKSDGTLQ